MNKKAIYLLIALIVFVAVILLVTYLGRPIASSDPVLVPQNLGTKYILSSPDDSK